MLAIFPEGIFEWLDTSLEVWFLIEKFKK